MAHDIILIVSNENYSLLICFRIDKPYKPQGGANIKREHMKLCTSYANIEEDAKKALVERFNGILATEGAEVLERGKHGVNVA